MGNIGNLSAEKQISLYDGQPFISEQDVAAGDPNTPALTIEGPDGYVIAVDAGTPIAPEFRDSNGEKLDPSTRVIVQKCDRQGNPLGDGIIFNDTLGRFNYNKMRTDPDYMRKTAKSLMVDEREIVKVFVDVPDGANGYDAERSRFTLGDDTSDFGKAVEIVDHDDLTEGETQAVKSASQRSGGA
ncbi:head protein [Haloarcula californiae icosahedral virus 1]|uniref:VP7 n=1 Tax=Haloarcula californiae icosahedral virus 1 TaxID=1735722 RepID=A0A1C7A3R1_9VIRU|nr:head protein [Haloarcula californiae icosahedral virus 1]6H9C_D Chain D, VP7 [Haloarcula californiae ATCC 33799]6H9C_E Chain E, VP7 [Haloarcula californiae ATCC 33799]6H9C_F Chain F, VP7 [Haloarcula californiae ATCC 33799]6H9C_I Chain I, VP7 [Haloarcula californiae ATCC 33799]6H9C_J Chain J, VP7 [Haloarcula californiae ATCC 33799]6H9C_K Chain K, VP7 [Haloarcula californiae ATCC 33799]6H9C_L Chain L, VP7 [Haloarcula californiae ATCC 33799]6H9C_M Chain M, VP7 [Haloarcula californiae ATCC 3